MKQRWPMKQRWSLHEAEVAAGFILPNLTEHCEKIEIAGSVRRRKESVGDLEVVYIPARKMVPDGLFSEKTINLADEGIKSMELRGLIERRTNVKGSETFGEKIKLMRFRAWFAEGEFAPFSLLPIDFFATTSESWYNYLVCRTGPAESNIRIARAAQRKGWKWEPYSPGFTRAVGPGKETYAVTSEEEVFDFVGLPYLPPEERL